MTAFRCFWLFLAYFGLVTVLLELMRLTLDPKYSPSHTHTFSSRRGCSLVTSFKAGVLFHVRGQLKRMQYTDQQRYTPPVTSYPHDTRQCIDACSPTARLNLNKTSRAGTHWPDYTQDFTCTPQSLTAPLCVTNASWKPADAASVSSSAARLPCTTLAAISLHRRAACHGWDVHSKTIILGRLEL